MDEHKIKEIVRLIRDANNLMAAAMAGLEAEQYRNANRATDWADHFVPRHDPSEDSLQVRHYKKREPKIGD